MIPVIIFIAYLYNQQFELVNKLHYMVAASRIHLMHFTCQFAKPSVLKTYATHCPLYLGANGTVI